MRIVAIEGPSFAGKTNLLSRLESQLASDLTVVSSFCYVDSIIDLDKIPPARTQSADDQLNAFCLFMGIEAQRVQRLGQLDRNVHILLLDRSVDTLLAHAYALDHLLGYDAYRRVKALLPQMPHLVPDDTLYLDARPEILRARCELLDEPFDSFLIEPMFVSRFREYFFTEFPVSVRIHVIDAEANQQAVATEAVKLLSLNEGAEQ